MTKYTVRDNGTPYFRWANNTVKKLENQLKAGYPVDGDVKGELLIIYHTLPGAEDDPPYCMYLSALVPVDSPPPTGGGGGAYAILHETDGTERRFDEVV